MSRTISQLEQAVLDRLLSAARASGQPAVETPEAADYDWSVPHHFTQARWRRVNDFAAAAAEKASGALAALLGEPTEVQVGAVTQRFGANLAESGGEQANFAAEILDGTGRSCGQIILARSCAVGWVAQLLGGSQGEQDRELSASEAALLGDVFGALVGALSDASEATGGGKFVVGPQSGQRLFPLPDQAAEEFTQIDLRRDEASEAGAVSYILPCEALDALADADADRQGKKQPADTRKTMLAHLERASVVATAWFEGTRATVREIVALEQGDVLLMPVKLDSPVHLLVGDRRCFLGLPVAAAGRYAVRIVAPAETHDHARATSGQTPERNPTDG